ncbi:hypothetical protein Enr13x_07920 [Stieleria neptunia]|uniref:Uncharacterized protein n=1 Tax=Stieleria neptunia TaxID=2527979 RepID=A0A518HJC2_9BACT|nr:hypothetical protein [Stieleria neptunia]QDV40954.1 hypothetical protein Enr13x_07920 [Stieleria neptunia]
MNQRSTPSTRTTIGHLALAGLALTLAGCQSRFPHQRPQTITPAAYDSIVNNAGYRETQWTPLDPCDAWQSTIQYEPIDQHVPIDQHMHEQWYEHVSDETLPDPIVPDPALPHPIEQISHEVPSELANVDLASVDLAGVDRAATAPQLQADPSGHAASASSASASPASEGTGGASASVATSKWYEIESDPSEELEHVEIEYLR